MGVLNSIFLFCLFLMICMWIRHIVRKRKVRRDNFEYHFLHCLTKQKQTSLSEVRLQLKNKGVRKILSSEIYILIHSGLVATESSSKEITTENYADLILYQLTEAGEVHRSTLAKPALV
jgi:hypothetical protein